MVCQYYAFFLRKTEFLADKWVRIVAELLLQASIICVTFSEVKSYWLLDGFKVLTITKFYILRRLVRMVTPFRHFNDTSKYAKSHGLILILLLGLTYLLPCVQYAVSRYLQKQILIYHQVERRKDKLISNALNCPRVLHHYQRRIPQDQTLQGPEELHSEHMDMSSNIFYYCLVYYGSSSYYFRFLLDTTACSGNFPPLCEMTITYLYSR